MTMSALAPITTASSSAAVARHLQSVGSAAPAADPCAQPTPLIDQDLLLRFGRRWVALPDRQAPVVAHLLDNLGVMISASELAEIYAANGGSTGEEALRSLLFRVARRLADVGLLVTFARRRSGMMVTLPPVVIDGQGSTFR